MGGFFSTQGDTKSNFDDSKCKSFTNISKQIPNKKYIDIPKKISIPIVEDSKYLMHRPIKLENINPKKEATIFLNSHTLFI